MKKCLKRFLSLCGAGDGFLKGVDGRYCSIHWKQVTKPISYWKGGELSPSSKKDRVSTYTIRNLSVRTFFFL